MFIESGELVLSREQIREVDRIAAEKFGIPGVILMENAGRGCTDLLLSQGVTPNTPVVICCGKGNNGGDGFVMARHLEVQEVPVEVLIFEAPEKFSPDAATNFEILTKIGVPIHRLKLPADRPCLQKHLEHASWIVDGLLGTGASGGVRKPIDQIIECINAAGRPVFSIDVPSGLDCDLGSPGPGCVRATVTGTLLATKPGFRSPQALPYVGEVHVVEIGVPHVLLASLCGEQQ